MQTTLIFHIFTPNSQFKEQVFVIYSRDVPKVVCGCMYFKYILNHDFLSFKLIKLTLLYPCLSEHINNLNHNIDFFDPKIWHFEENVIKRFAEELFLQFHNDRVINKRFDNTALNETNPWYLNSASKFVKKWQDSIASLISQKILS